VGRAPRSPLRRDAPAPRRARSPTAATSRNFQADSDRIEFGRMHGCVSPESGRRPPRRGLRRPWVHSGGRRKEHGCLVEVHRRDCRVARRPLAPPSRAKTQATDGHVARVLPRPRGHEQRLRRTPFVVYLG
jgi:hypothetical protein